MKGMNKYLREISPYLILDKDPIVPWTMIRETTCFEVRAAQMNSFTYWDFFDPTNIRRSNVMRSQIQKAQTEKNAAVRRVSGQRRTD